MRPRLDEIGTEQRHRRGCCRNDDIASIEDLFNAGDRGGARPATHGGIGKLASFSVATAPDHEALRAERLRQPFQCERGLQTRSKHTDLFDWVRSKNGGGDRRRRRGSPCRQPPIVLEKYLT